MAFTGRIPVHDFPAPGRTAMEYQLFGIIYHPGKTVEEVRKMTKKRGKTILLVLTLPR